MEFNALLETFKNILIIDFLRYFIPASIAFLLVWIILKKNLEHRFIQKRRPDLIKICFEFKYSMSTVIIFALIGVLITKAENYGAFHIYDKINDYSWGYFFLSLVLMVLLHDFYFYWTHRWMHHPNIFKHVHLVHHLSTNPSPWAAYSFHPIEAVIQALVLPIILMILPVHEIAIAIFLIYMILRNVWGHLGYELFPNKFIKLKWLNWNTTTTHHSMHHQYSRCNYGLYFTCWDNWMKTAHDKYEDAFNEVASKKRQSSSKTPLLVIILMMLISSGIKAQSPEGKWKTFNEQTGESLSIITISKNLINNSLYGVIDSIIVPPYGGDNGICIKCDGKKKNQPFIGLEFLWGFKESDETWLSGKVLDPETGAIYNSKIWLNNANEIKIRGYGGRLNLFYRTQVWNRLNGKGKNTLVVRGFWAPFYRTQEWERYEPKLN